MKVYYVTTSVYKTDELADYAQQFNLAARHIEVCVVRQELQEILHPEIEVMVHKKAVDAYAYLHRPCVVEHGGLFMDALPGLPGSVGQIVWDAVGDRMCDFLRSQDARGATARSVLGYCDGRQVRVYRGETRGRIAEGARGAYAFRWDTIFIPDGEDRTYGELGREGKRATSPAVKAWSAFLDAEFPPRPGAAAPHLMVGSSE